MSPIQSPHMRSLAKEEPEEETVKEEVEEEDRLQEVGERDGLEDLLGNSTDSGEEDVREEEVKGEQEADKGTKEVQEAEMEVTEQEDPESQAEMEVVAAGSVDLFQETQGEQEQEEGGEVEAAGGAAMEEEATKEAAPAPGPSLTSGQQGAASFSSLSLSSEEVSTRGQGVVSTSGQETVSWQGLLAFLTRQEEVLEGGSPSQLGELGRNLGQGLARMVQLQCKLVEKCVGKVMVNGHVVYIALSRLFWHYTPAPLVVQPLYGQPLVGQPLEGQPLVCQPLDGQPLNGLNGQPIQPC